MKAALLVGLGLGLGLVLAAPVAAQPDPRAQIFVQRGCADCHALAGLKVKAKADVGPDLTDAYSDVTTRYGVTLERFFEHPVGMMRFVFASGQARVTKADSDSLVAILRALYLERLAAREPRLRRGHEHQD